MKEVTKERLLQDERGEERLRALGFSQVRLRHHGELARIEVGKEELSRALEPGMVRDITSAITPLGFTQVLIDPEGYRTGSLNEVLKISSSVGLES